MKIHDRPSVTKTPIFCKKCNYETHVFFTKEEVENNIEIMQHCNYCKRITSFVHKESSNLNIQHIKSGGKK